jgi:hypothetical protein
MSSPTLRYSKKSNLRVRPMAEWQGLMVFAPEQPNIYLLNQTSGVMLELCDGRPAEELRRDFLELVADRVEPGEAAEIFDESLRLLEQRGLVDSTTEEIGTA